MKAPQLLISEALQLMSIEQYTADDMLREAGNGKKLLFDYHIKCIRYFSKTGFSENNRCLQFFKSRYGTYIPIRRKFWFDRLLNVP